MQRTSDMLYLVLFIISLVGVFSFSVQRQLQAHPTARTRKTTQLEALFSRRQLGQQVAWAGAALLPPAAALAKDASSYDVDKAKLVKGYDRLTYLLEHWDQETTFCGTQIDPFSGEQVCEKTPLVVQEYMGYKSMNDPLFKADKTLRRLEDLVPASLEGEYLDAIERWATTADEAAGMAYTSSWAGPQNPNGGDDNIAYYLDRAKKQVVEARSVLANVLRILELT